ncbi:MAG: protein kinase [Planctomycetia bacterium]|nr:protein kinase [Planctomycetia bacterium]
MSFSELQNESTLRAERNDAVTEQMDFDDGPTAPVSANGRDTAYYASDDASDEESVPHVQPATIPGYTLERFLGSGAYGEVWVATQENTGRRVAVKFYTHRGGLNSELLSQEVEKLSLLFSDRYVVQLLSVGWEATPPYYVMEFLENGSLAERLARGKLRRSEAERIFEELLMGIRHAHEKGIVHCDLKPGNILLDRDGNPHLADFGQSRLSHDMSPALGTMFFMAPEQASLTATPDPKWDIYALGAILYNMLTGRPPYYAPGFVERIQSHKKLSHRLHAYRHLLETEPVPTDHRELLLGAGFPLALLIEKCLQANPEKRYQNISELYSAWRRYRHYRNRRPLILLGAVTPLVLLFTMAFFIVWAFQSAFREGIDALQDSTLRGEHFAAQSIARTAEYELARRFDAVEQLASHPEFRQAVEEAVLSPEWKQQTSQLANPQLSDREIAERQERFIEHSGRKKIQSVMEKLLPEDFQPEAFRGVELKEASIPPTVRVMEHEIQQISEAIDRHAGKKPTSEIAGTGISEEDRPPGFLPGEFVQDMPVPLVSKRLRANVASWFFCDADGISAVRIPFSTTIGKDYSPLILPYREMESNREVVQQNFFPSSHVVNKAMTTTTISDVYRSPVTGQWIVSISAPVFSNDPSHRFLGIVSMAVGVGRFINMANTEEHFAVLVDNRPGKYHGLILQHPLYDRLIAEGKPLPEDFLLPKFRVLPENIPDTHEKAIHYRDPMGNASLGKALFSDRWMAQCEKVHLGTGDNGEWLVLVQESYDDTIGMVKQSMEKHYYRVNLIAGAVFVGVLLFMWFLVRRMGHD